MSETEHNIDSKQIITIDDLINNQKLMKCYQMQIDDNNNCTPVYLGSYPDVPMPINKQLKYNNYDLLVVTYILTEDEIKNKIYKIVGVNVFKKNNKNSIYSLDLIKNEDSNNYQLIFSDHQKNITQVVKNLENFPDKDKIIEYIIEKSFENPLKSILIND